MDNKKISQSRFVCLGGGVGTANLLRGLKAYTTNITAVVSMADDGGSSGRLRRLFNILPPGDIINCMIALSEADDRMQNLLQYRFPGNRYGADKSIYGQKIGNLLFASLQDITGDVLVTIAELEKMFNTKGKIYPSTLDQIGIEAKTSTHHIVKREQNIDKGLFKGEIRKLYLQPKDPRVPKEVITAIRNADCIIAGPGDLYTTIMPVLLIPAILQAVIDAKAKKFFVVNVANKSFETKNYTISDFANAIKKHTKSHIFDTFFINNKIDAVIPKKFKKQYSFVPLTLPQKVAYNVVTHDLIDEEFPLYHNSDKLAKAVIKQL